MSFIKKLTIPLVQILNGTMLSKNSQQLISVFRIASVSALIYAYVRYFTKGLDYYAIEKEVRIRQITDMYPEQEPVSYEDQNKLQVYYTANMYR